MLEPTRLDLETETVHQYCLQSILMSLIVKVISWSVFECLYFMDKIAPGIYFALNISKLNFAETQILAKDINQNTKQFLSTYHVQNYCFHFF